MIATSILLQLHHFEVSEVQVFFFAVYELLLWHQYKHKSVLKLDYIKTSTHVQMYRINPVLKATSE